MNTSKKYKLVVTGLVIMVILNIVVIGTLWFFKPPLMFRSAANFDSKFPDSRISVENELGLSDSQREAFLSLRIEYFNSVRPIMDRISETREQLYESIVTKGDRINTDSLIIEISKNYEEVERVNYAHFNELKSVLNENQMENFDVFLDRISGFNNRMGAPFGEPFPLFRQRKGK